MNSTDALKLVAKILKRTLLNNDEKALLINIVIQEDSIEIGRDSDIARRAGLTPDRYLRAKRNLHYAGVIKISARAGFQPHYSIDARGLNLYLMDR